MHRIAFFWILFLFFNCAIAQEYFTLKGIVYDAENKQPLPFVNIIINGKNNLGGYTGIEGKFSLKSPEPIRRIDLQFIGYERKTIEIDDHQSFIEVFLIPSSVQLQEFIVKPGENPAIPIISKTIEQRKYNDPEKNASFRYISYNKLIVTVNDSLLELRDSTVSMDDSTWLKTKEFFDDKHLFITETVTEKMHIPPAKSQETVLTSRISGFQHLLFGMVSTELQSFSIYGDYFTLLGKNYVSPISRGSLSRYAYILRDTLFDRKGDTLWVIQFFPKKGTLFEAIKGFMHIHAKDFAVVHFICEPAERKSNDIFISIKQEYQKIADRFWFPSQYYAKSDFTNITVNGIYPTGVSWTYFREIELNPDIQKKFRSDVAVVLDEKAMNNHKLLDQWRKDSLDAKERRTYEYIDSVGKANKLDEQVLRWQNLLNSIYPLNKHLGIRLDKILSYNNYEKIRIGIGFQSIGLWRNRWTNMVYAAYAFGDKRWKYGAESTLKLAPKHDFILKIFYDFDVIENSMPYPTTNKKFFESGTQSYRQISANNFDYQKRMGSAVQFRLPFYTSLSAGFDQINRSTGYRIDQYLTESVRNIWQNFYDYYQTSIHLRWQFREKFVQTPTGLISQGSTFPELHFRWQTGFFQSSFNPMFEKYECWVKYKKPWKFIGETFLFAHAGQIMGSIPETFLWMPAYNGTRFGLQSDFSMETVLPNEFLADRFVFAMFKHRFKDILWNTNKFNPRLAIIQNFYMGDLRSSFTFSTHTYKIPSKGIFESGLLIERILKLNFSSIGFAGFYRWGFYAHSNRKNNLFGKFLLQFEF